MSTPAETSSGKERWKKRFADHPLIAWAVENGCIVSLALAAHSLRPVDRRSLAYCTFRAFVSGIVIVEGSVAIQRVLCGTLYKHIPYFFPGADKRPKYLSWDMFKDFLSVLFPANLFGAWCQGMLMMYWMDDKAYKQMQTHKFRLIPFLLKLAVLRFGIDVTFYLVHRLLHHPAVYGWVHKKHHEHKVTGLATNYHFTILDLVLEGFTPPFSAIMAMIGLSETFPKRLSYLTVSELDFRLFFAYAMWYEIGSHCGKPVPTVTAFPPLSPLYNSLKIPFLGKQVDRHNVRFHQAHHTLFNCNYGITPWMDRLLGTCRPSSLYDTTKTIS